MTSVSTSKSVRSCEVQSNEPHQFYDLIYDFCSKLNYKGPFIIKHLFDNESYSAFRANWYCDDIDSSTIVLSPRIFQSHFVIIDLATMEIKIRDER